jgi:hypothetical protein
MCHSYETYTCSGNSCERLVQCIQCKHRLDLWYHFLCAFYAYCLFSELMQIVSWEMLIFGFRVFARRAK